MKSFTTISAALSLLLIGLLIGLLGPSCAPAATQGSTGQGLVVNEPESRSAQAGAEGGLVDEHGHDHGSSASLASDLEIRSYYHDFGVIADGLTVSYTFEMTNTDAVPLTITRMSPSCGCTVPAVRYFDSAGTIVEGQPSNEPEILVVPPGSRVELDVRIDTNRVRTKNVHKLMQVRITTDSQNDPYLTLECSLMVQQPFRILGGGLTLGRMPSSIGGGGSTEISMTGDSGARLTGLGAIPEGVRATLEDKQSITSSIWKLSVEVDPPLLVGSFRGDLEVLTETAEGEPRESLFVGMRGAVIPDLRIAPNRILLRDFKSGGISSTSVQVSTLIPGARFQITGVEKTGAVKDFIDVEWLPLDGSDAIASANWTITITARPGIDADSFSGRITLLTDDPQTPKIEITYAGL